jgi:hypothetical protein
VIIQILPTFFSRGSLSALLAPATPLPFFPEFVKRAKDFSCNIADYHQDPLLTERDHGFREELNPSYDLHPGIDQSGRIISNMASGLISK